MVRRQWWEYPELRSDADGRHERRVDWLELFFDLVFVVVIAELAHSLATHVSLAGVASYALLFVAAWWVWIGGVFYTERFETFDISIRLFTVALMIPVAAMALFVHDALGATGTGFALAYAAARTIVTFMWLRAGWHVPAFRPVSQRYALGFGLSIALFTSSIFVAPPARFALWGLGLAIDLVTPITTLRLQRQLPRFSASRLPERFGLFVIIVLGEAIAGVIRGVAAAEELSVATGLMALIGLLLAFGLWWVYFDYVGRWQPRRGVWWTFAWNYLHLPLVMAIAAIGAGVLDFIAPTSSVTGANLRILIAGAMSVALVAIGLIELTLQPDPRLRIDRRLTAALKLATGVGALAIGLAGRLPPSALLLGLLLLLTLHMGYGAYVWYRRPALASLTGSEVEPEAA